MLLPLQCLGPLASNTFTKFVEHLDQACYSVKWEQHLDYSSHAILGMVDRQSAALTQHYKLFREDMLCRLIKETVEHWGTVDVLVNNAGITRDTLIMRMKPEQWQSVIDTNLSAVFYASQVRFNICVNARVCW